MVNGSNMPRSLAPMVNASTCFQPGVTRTVMPRSLMYWFERGSNSPQSPPVQSPAGGVSSAGLRPPKPPKLVHSFCEKRELGALAVVAVALAGHGGEVVEAAVVAQVAPQPLGVGPAADDEARLRLG